MNRLRGWTAFTAPEKWHPHRHEKRQLIQRLPLEFVVKTIADFNGGELTLPEACALLGIGKSRLYQLRTEWLSDRHAFSLSVSGGDHRDSWPEPVIAFLHEFLPLQSPPNFQLVADELLRLHQFQRSRSTFEAFAKKHLPHLIPKTERKARPYQRFRRARFGELWQHDSSIHQWWPANQKQTLLLTVDDHSGFIVAGRLVSRDTTWNHFCHFRNAFETYGLPRAIYTDALSLFGPSSSHDNRDPRSEFQRALKALGVAHLVAPTPQAKGKIERRFGTFQNRMVALFAHAKVDDFLCANEILQMEISRQNDTRLASTKLIPRRVFEEASSKRAHDLRPCPSASLLDLHFSLRASRKVHNDNTIEFDGRPFQIAPTARRFVTALFHPFSQLWVLDRTPTDSWPLVLGRFSL